MADIIETDTDEFMADIPESLLIRSVEDAYALLPFEEKVRISAMADRLVAQVKRKNPRLQFSKSAALIVLAACGLIMNNKRFGDAIMENKKQ